MAEKVKVKGAAKKFRLTLLLLFVAYTVLHHFVFHFSYEVYTAIVGTLIIGGLAVEVFYMKLLEDGEYKNVSKRLKITLLILFALFVAIHFSVYHFSYNVISAVVGTMIVAGLTLDIFYKRALET